jgi:hypothetical protein
MLMGALLLLILILLVIGAVPAYPYSRKWGYYPSGGLGLLLVILLVLILVGGVPWWGFGPGPPVHTVP